MNNSNNIIAYSFFSVMVVLCLSLMILQNFTISFYIDTRLNELVNENSLLKTQLRQVEYASIYMGQSNGAFPINSEKITLVTGTTRGPYDIFDEYKNIPYFYNLKILDIDFDLLGNRNLPNKIYPDITNIHVKKLIIKNVDHLFHQKKIFESFPNLEELEININGVYGNGFTGDDLFNTTKYCNPSTKLKKIVFNQDKRNAGYFTPVKEYYSTRGVEFIINLVE